jgi:hypothetical protein
MTEKQFVDLSLHYYSNKFLYFYFILFQLQSHAIKMISDYRLLCSDICYISASFDRPLCVTTELIEIQLL